MTHPIFEEVRSDYVDSETGETAIDGYLPDSEQGVVVAWVNSSGSFRLGDHAEVRFLFCPRFQEALRDVIIGIYKSQIAVSPASHPSTTLAQKTHG